MTRPFPTRILRSHLCSSPRMSGKHFSGHGRLLALSIQLAGSVAYSVFLTHRRKDYWGPDGMSLTDAIGSWLSVDSSQHWSSTLTDLSMRGFTSISRPIHLYSYLSMPGRAYALVNSSPTTKCHSSLFGYSRTLIPLPLTGNPKPPTLALRSNGPISQDERAKRNFGLNLI